MTTWTVPAKSSPWIKEHIMTKHMWWKEKTSGTVNARVYAALLPFVTASVVLAELALFSSH